MNPGSSEASGLNLPPPVGETLTPAPAGLENQSPSVEKGPASPEINRSGGAAAPPIIPLPLPSDNSTPLAPTANPRASKPVSAATVTADDGDLIEKEWVNKAKAIVERTRQDPHKQSQELTVVKADYMKQRYGKTIKVNP